MQLIKLASFTSLVALTASAASIGVTNPVDAASIPASDATTTAVVNGSYIDVQIPDSSASNGYVDIKVPLGDFSPATYSSLVAGAEGQRASEDCIPVGGFCTWGYWDCCGNAGCLLFGLVGGVCT